MSATFELVYKVETIERAVKNATSTNSVEATDGGFAQHMIQVYVQSWPHTALAKKTASVKFGYTPGSVGAMLARFVGLSTSDVKPLTSAELKSIIASEAKVAPATIADLRAQLAAAQAQLAKIQK